MRQTGITEHNDQNAEKQLQTVAYISGLVIVTALGGSTEMTAAALNAGISAYQASDYYNAVSYTHLRAHETF